MYPYKGNKYAAIILARSQDEAQERFKVILEQGRLIGEVDIQFAEEKTGGPGAPGWHNIASTALLLTLPVFLLWPIAFHDMPHFLLWWAGGLVGWWVILRMLGRAIIRSRYDDARR